MESSPDGSAPLVSVIVPVRNRSVLLRACLEALRVQTWRDFEVVVVDDGSSDSSGEEAEAAARQGLPARVLRTPGVGAVAARTLGVAAARGRYLAFTDSDCRPEPRWIEAGVAALDAGADLAVGPTAPVRAAQPLERSVYALVEDGLYATCNVFYRRAAFERVGGFDREAGRWLGFRRTHLLNRLGFGEDTLVAWRVRRDGGRATFVPEAMVRHALLRDPLGEMLKRAWQAGGFAALVREVPELRSTLLRWHVFLSLRRIPLYLTLIGTLLPGRAWWVGGFGLAWVGWHARTSVSAPGTWRRRLAAIPIEMTVDTVTAVALLWGSARSRSLVL